MTSLAYYINWSFFYIAIAQIYCAGKLIFYVFALHYEEWLRMTSLKLEFAQMIIGCLIHYFLASSSGEDIPTTDVRVNELLSKAGKSLD